MKTLTIFYDGDCGLCGKFRDHFMAEPRRKTLHFIPYQSARVREWVPNMDSFDPAREMVARTDEGRVLQGVGAWLELLAAMDRYRGLAGILRVPIFRPITGFLYRRVARNRRKLSRWLGLENLTTEELCERCAG